MLWATLNVSFGTHNNASASCFVSTTYPLHAHNVATRREVGRFNVVHQLFDGNVGVVNVSHAAINYLAQVVCRNVSCHTYGNTTRTIHQKVGDACRHYAGFVARVIKVTVHVNRFLLNVLHHSLAYGREACFSITHSCCRVTIHWTKVSLTFDQGVTHIPWLCQTHQSSIYRTITVWVVLTEHITHYTCRLTSRLVMGDA